jgi:hypothetical protein
VRVVRPVMKLIGVGKVVLIVAAIGVAVVQKLRGPGSPVTIDEWPDVANKPPSA